MLNMMKFIALIVTGIISVHAGFDLGYGDDLDLTNYVTRPEIKMPRFNITIHDASLVAPGYWFVAPYINIIQARFAPLYYQPCTTGPAIYDSSGELVWSGACKFRNQNTCDFRAFRSNGTDYLSSILSFYEHDPAGRNMVLDNSFEVVRELNTSKVFRTANMHEFNVINEGRSALMVVHKTQWTDVSSLEPFGCKDGAGWVVNMGIQEVNLSTGEVLFEWWSLDHVPVKTSSVEIKDLAGPPPLAWNFFHINSVDKNADGDYMISARFTDCIYKISGQDGSILWRLGGDESDFILDGFNFSRQHDARFIEQNSTTTVISFLDNASDSINHTSTHSSALLVALDTSSSPMVARVIRRWVRPDEKLSMLRGNAQLLANGNMFTGWSDNSYITEHTYDGKLLMEAQFSSKRLVTYRAYKFEFLGRPSTPPVMKAQAYGPSPKDCVTVCHVSWNGATEVYAWEFYRNNTRLDSELDMFVGRAIKKGFETTFHVVGYEPSLFVQAVSENGERLGQSVVMTTDFPTEWLTEVDRMKAQDDLLTINQKGTVQILQSSIHTEL